MTSEQIRLALTIAETGSISNAARKVYLTQPTVSGILAALEREVGCTLFVRSSHGVSPTAEGMEFLRSARRIVQELDGIAQLGRQGEICRLHLTSFSSTRVERAFTKFCLNHQRMRLDISYEILSCSIERAASLIYDGKTDVVLTVAVEGISNVQRQLLDSRHLIYEPIARLPIAVTMAQSYPLCQGALTLDRAAQFTRLEDSRLRLNSSIYPESVRMQFQQAPSIQIQSRTMRIQLAAAGIGFFIGMPMRAEELAQNGLTCRIIPGLQLHLAAVRSEEASNDSQQAELLSLVRREYEYECDAESTL